ncbi:unnamed protein product [Allacma fusca]|uniref:Integrase catalytic domain-containing protein n=1 Tax=Allacma fusca TaxID=39272 RepID=A0A8J2KX84_9HEXA|nr:unnamed protein product [Allacma fusca]
MSVSGISATAATRADHYVNLSFSSNVYNIPPFHVQAAVLVKVMTELPTYPVDASGWKHIQDLALADPNFQRPESVDILLGADILPQIYRSTIIRGAADLPVTQDTALGWIIFGPTPAQVVPKIITHVATLERIIWRNRQNEPLKSYQLLTVTYGEASAPFQAERTSIQLANDFQSKYPLAVAVVRRDFYMDDVLTGESSIPRAIALQSELMSLMSEAKFTLRKWSSSVPAVLENLPNHLLTIRGKLLMQSLWKMEAGWDEKLNEEVNQIWSTYRQELLSLAKLRIPRGISANDADSFQLHGFSDASERAYAAAVYLRTTTLTGRVHCQLICSKTKVAPTKQVTLPRLELCGAVLLCRLDAHFKFATGEQVQSEPAKSALLEERKISAVNVTVLVDTSLCERYSSIGRLQRITALVLRFRQNVKAKKNGWNKHTGPLTVLELRLALQALIKTVQENEYSEELKALSRKESISSRSKILSLCPILDQNGLLRVGGRLRKSHLPYDQKHPVLLPRSHVLTKLIVEEVHQYLLHGGPQLVLFTLQQRYWIVRGKDLVRSVVRRCKPCVIQRAQIITQQMGDLPERRVTPSQPFCHVGVDYAGPVTLRNMKGRKSQLFKAYICIFVCFGTRAVHLELVSDLSSSAFIAALHRFTARRGKPVSISSDNGTNFVGANREMQDFIRLMRTKENNDVVSKTLSQEGIQWIFNPPAAPHMGGLWEAGVKSVKHHLRRTLGETPLNFEEYATLLAQVESCLNSRPLCPASADPNDFTALSPGHFLTGSPLVAIPEPDYTHVKVNRLSRWQHLQYMQQHFWNRWSQEYLTRLQQRPKWKLSQPNLKEGDLVVILDEQLPPNKWKMARIIELHPGSDGHVRIVSVKTTDGVTKRPVVKLCGLPMESTTVEDSESVV